MGFGLNYSGVVNLRSCHSTIFRLFLLLLTFIHLDCTYCCMGRECSSVYMDPGELSIRDDRMMEVELASEEW